MKAKNILITGSTGLIGKKLLKKLINQDFELTCIYRNSIPKEFHHEERIKWIQCDLEKNEIEFPSKLKFYAAILLCGKTLGARLTKKEYYNANEITLLNSLNSICHKTKRIIFASSQCVYGNPSNTNIDETFKTQQNFDFYALSKYNAEILLKKYQEKFNGMYISLRLTGFIGGGGNIDYIVSNAVNNKDIVLYSNGQIRRDYISFEYGLEVITKLLLKRYENNYFVFNVGSGQIISAHKIAKEVCKRLNSKSEIILSSKKPSIGDCVLNNNKIRQFIKIQKFNLLDEIIHYTNTYTK